MNRSLSPVKLKSHTLKPIAAAVAMLVAATVSPTALSQQRDGIVALEEVIVTARKREESIQDVPISVTSIGKELQEASIRRLDDIQGLAPNLYMRNNSRAGVALSIRGVSYQETDKSYDPAIGVIMDGMYLGTSAGSLLQNFDTERIEVLRGPQGTLFGKNTVGGVINIIRGEVTQEWGADLSVTLGEDGREDYKAVVNIPVIEDKLGVKVFGFDINSDGYIENTTLNKDVGGDDLQNYGFATLWDATDNFSVKLHYQHDKDKTDSGAWANLNQPEDLTCVLDGALWTGGCESTDPGSDEDHVSSDRRNTNDTDIDTYIATINWDLDSFLITSITAYRDQDEHNLSAFDSSPANLLYLDYYNDWEQTSQELRLTSQFSDKIEFVAGAYYWDVSYEQRWDVGELNYVLDLIGAVPANPPGSLTPTSLNHNGQDQDTTSYAGFISGDYHVNDQWTITAGLRYTYEEKDFSGADGAYYDPGAGDPRPDLPMRDYDDDWDHWSPKIGFSYNYNDDVMVFGSFTEGFKSGGFIGRQANFPDSFDPSYDPETVENWELGMKSTWMDGRMIFNPTVFYSTYDDKQEDILVPIDLSNVASIVANASTLDIYGLELELQFQVTDAWNISANYGYLNSDYDSYVADVNGDGIKTDNSDRTPRNTPENTFGISTTYTMAIGPGEFVAYGAYRWRDEIEVIADNNPLGSIDSIDNLNMTLNYIWNDGRYRLTAYGRNITDEREVNAAIIGGLTSWGQWNEGKTFGGEFAVKF
jgi:iron complex outermembrane receptor protein